MILLLQTRNTWLHLNLPGDRGFVLETNNKKANYIFAIAGFLILLALDRFTKYLAVTGLKDTPGIDIIPGALRLEYLENTGAAFGVMQGMQSILLVVTVVVLLGILYIYIRIPADRKYLFLRIIAVFIIAGAIGNMIDRFLYNYVVDFIYFSLIDFPVFNVADCYITLSVLLLFILILFYYKDEDLNFIFKHKETNS